MALFLWISLPPSETQDLIPALCLSCKAGEDRQDKPGIALADSNCNGVINADEFIFLVENFATALPDSTRLECLSYEAYCEYSLPDGTMDANSFVAWLCMLLDRPNDSMGNILSEFENVLMGALKSHCIKLK